MSRAALKRSGRQLRGLPGAGFDEPASAQRTPVIPLTLTPEERQDPVRRIKRHLIYAGLFQVLGDLRDRRQPPFVQLARELARCRRRIEQGEPLDFILSGLAAHYSRMRERYPELKQPSHSYYDLGTLLGGHAPPDTVARRSNSPAASV